MQIIYAYQKTLIKKDQLPLINQDILDLNAYLKFGNMQSVNILNNGFGYKDLSQINQRYSNQ